MSDAVFDLAALRCGCGSGAAVTVIDPGRCAERDPVFSTIVLHRLAARGWCAACYGGIARCLPQAPKRGRRADG